MADAFRRQFESPDDPPLPDESRLRALLEEMLETGSSPEQVSGGDLRLQRVLRERLRRARDVEAQMEAMFPSPDGREESTRRAMLEGLRTDVRLPEIPGYEVDSVIGSGGMGVVYRARHLRLDRWVAIKMVLLGAYASRDQMECLLREAQDVAALRHPNIVQVYEVGEHGGFPYFAMEFLDGGDLARALNGKPRPAREAADLIRVLAGAVNAAHVGGIVHRDLKPGNVLLGSDGIPKIADFSLARRLEHESTIMTHARQVGTPSYMAPEQAAGDSAATRPAVDIYALGAILYELLTGRPPFKAESSTETRRQVITEEPVPPSRLNARVPRDLQTICLKCLLKDPSRRYETAADLADDLERFARGEPIMARPVGAVERAIKWCRRRPSAAIALSVIALAVVAAAAGGVRLRQAQEARQTAEAIRRESARASIEAALPSLSQFVRTRQWMDAVGVLRTAQARLADARSPELGDRLAAIQENFEVAQELDRVRQNFLGIDDAGYTHSPARESYSRIFSRTGIGSDVVIEVAAGRVRESPLCAELLIALDLAAFAEHTGGGFEERDRLLAVARAASPNPWQDRFRDPSGWGDAAHLQRLIQDAPLAEPSPPSHQVFLIARVLSKADAGASLIEILREAQLRDPSDVWVTIALADALRRAGNPEAVQFYRTATALQPTNVVAWCMLGWTLTANGDPEGAVAPLKKAIALRPEYALGLEYLLYALARNEQWASALDAAREFSAAHPQIELPAVTKLQLLRCRAYSAAAQREWSIAAEAYSQLLKGSSRDTEGLFELAAVRLLAGDLAGYREVCASMLERCESAGLRRFLVARACTLATVSARELAHAADLGMRELDDHADHHWSLRARAALLCRDGRHGEAIAFLHRSLQSTSRPEHRSVIWAWLSRAHLGLGEHDAAKLWLGKVADWLDESDTKPKGVHFHDWLEALVLRRECETELAP
ncbi:MAG TPA: protein kinase [Phycisphaerales bacterium]|nr:protein kinase [Phycisphaerales bacterium]HMP38265.1 protein kinase [Phycisphaerales bacterium]